MLMQLVVVVGLQLVLLLPGQAVAAMGLLQLVMMVVLMLVPLLPGQPMAMIGLGMVCHLSPMEMPLHRGAAVVVVVVVDGVEVGVEAQAIQSQPHPTLQQLEHLSHLLQMFLTVMQHRRVCFTQLLGMLARCMLGL